MISKRSENVFNKKSCIKKTIFRTLYKLLVVASFRISLHFCSHSFGSKSLFRFVCPDDPSSHLLRIVKLFDYQIASLLGNRHFFLWLLCFLELDLKSPPLQSTLQKPKIDGFSAFRNRRRFFYGIFKILSWSWKLIYKSFLVRKWIWEFTRGITIRSKDQQLLEVKWRILIEFSQYFDHKEGAQN